MEKTVKLNFAQEEALKAALAGNSIFITGGAGSGKTFLLREMISHLKKQGRKVAVTASTGLAAVHLSGRTVHSFLGSGICSTSKELEQFEKEKPLKVKKIESNRLNECETLVIDEISMLTGVWLDMADGLVRHKRRKGKDVFGGLQIIFCGDFLQLPPVIKNRDEFPMSRQFAFEADCWELLKLRVFNLIEVFRQKDKDFCDALNHFRFGDFKERYVGMFDKLVVERDHVRKDNPVRLFPTNRQTEECNRKYLAGLSGSKEVFKAKLFPSDAGQVNWNDRYGDNFLADVYLELKAGASVLIIANLDTEGGIVNGTRGVIKELSSNKVKVLITEGPSKGRKIVLGTIEDLYTWEIKNSSGIKVKASISQLPLKLSYALTVHKSQGMSLENVHVCLTSNFEKGQVYVALSRACSLKGLTLDRPLRKNDIVADGKCVNFHSNLIV